MGQTSEIARQTAPIRLNLGCGLLAAPGWVNIDGSWNARLAKHPSIRRALSSLRVLPPGKMDIPWSSSIVVHDIRRQLPFPNGSVAAVYASHVLEHLYLHEGRALIRESFRVLTCGGVLRVVVPDLRAIVDEYLGGRPFGSLSEEMAGMQPADRFNVRLLMRSPEPPSSNVLYRIYDAWKDFHSHKWMYDFGSLVALLRWAGFADVQAKECHMSRIEDVEVVEDKSRVLNGAGICVEGVKPCPGDDPA